MEFLLTSLRHILAGGAVSLFAVQTTLECDRETRAGNMVRIYQKVFSDKPHPAQENFG